MAAPMTSAGAQSPASRVMAEAIELAIEGSSPYPDRAVFLDADEPTVGRAIARAADDGIAVVLVSDDGQIRVLHPTAV